MLVSLVWVLMVGVVVVCVAVTVPAADCPERHSTGGSQAVLPRLFLAVLLCKAWPCRTHAPDAEPTHSTARHASLHPTPPPPHASLTQPCHPPLLTLPTPPAHAHADVEYEENLLYFLEFGVQPGDGCDYLIVVQEVRGGVGLTGAQSVLAVAGFVCSEWATGCGGEGEAEL